MRIFEKCEDKKCIETSWLIYEKKKINYSFMYMLPLVEHIRLEKINWKTDKNNLAKYTIARLDEIHPIISGNKLFKLKYNLEEAAKQQKGILTMGGAYSNHLAATAFACKEAGLASIGLVRGEMVTPLNSTLRFCVENKMNLIAIQRKDFYNNSNVVQKLMQQHSNFYFVPEGGSNKEGEKGCTEILSLIHQADTFSHIICAAGTATTCRGIAASATTHQTVVVIPVIKIPKEEQPLFIQKHLNIDTDAAIDIFFEFAGKGYAQKEEILFSFMNRFYKETKVSLDFVYTAKLIMAVNSLFDANYFSETHKVLVLHTGGLQGNDSLPEDVLKYR